MAECTHKNRKDANFCYYCGIPLKEKVRDGAKDRAKKKDEEEIPVSELSALEVPFGKVSKNFLAELELIDATELVQIVRRPDETMEVDVGELDPDSAIALMVKGLIQYTVGELMEIYEVEDDEDEDEDEDDDEG